MNDWPQVMYAIKYSILKASGTLVDWWWTGETKNGVTIFDRQPENAYLMEIDDAELTLAGIGFPFHTFPDESEVIARVLDKEK